jgi:uncharacterized protein YicC (UPF0701 family)
MRSMTGYGRGEVDRGGVKVTVELNSVNRKQSDIVINLPRDLAELEPRIRQTINEKLSRGRTSVSVALQEGANGKPQARPRHRARSLLSRCDARIAERTRRAGRDHDRHDPAGARRDAILRAQSDAETCVADGRGRARWCVA